MVSDISLLHRVSSMNKQRREKDFVVVVVVLLCWGSPQGRGWSEGCKPGFLEIHPAFLELFPEVKAWNFAFQSSAHR